MFGLFSKKNPVHEPLELQISDVKKLNPLLANKVLPGLSCDKLPNATGEFGSITNPIPVNGQLGEIKYLGKLRGKTGHAVFFHRIGSTIAPISKNPIDIFELVCHDATQWNKLYLDPQDIPPVEGETYEVVASCHNCATIGKYRIPVGRKWTDYWEGMWLSPEGSSHYAIGAGREQVHCFNCGYAMLIRGPRMEVEKRCITTSG